MNTAMWWAIALGAGFCSTLQSAANGSITRTMGSYMAMACNFVFFFLFTILFVAYGANRKQLDFSQFKSLKPEHFLGGIFGFGVVLFLTLAFPRLGALTTIALMILGQSAVALIIDSQGLWGVPVVAISFHRVAAVLLILGGVIMVNR